jgi:hypothetical protein
MDPFLFLIEVAGFILTTKLAIVRGFCAAFEAVDDCLNVSDSSIPI